MKMNLAKSVLYFLINSLFMSVVSVILWNHVVCEFWKYERFGFWTFCGIWLIFFFIVNNVYAIYNFWRGNEQPNK
jgi:hypothetical protein